MKRIYALFLCVLMTLMPSLGSLAQAETTETAAIAPTYYTHNGRVTLIDGACTDAPVNGFDDAAAVVDDLLDQLGGDDRTELTPWRDLTDAFDNHYFVFQQMCDNTTVMGGAVKVITDADGHMLGLTSSIVSDLPEAQRAEGVTAEAAEQIVLDHELEIRQRRLALQAGMTSRMILPVALEVDIEAEDNEGSRYVWVVYTDNPDSSLDRASDLPYLAHYVTLTGEYLYRLPTIIPGDEAGKSGFDSSYVFEFMEPVDYTGYVDLSTGGELEVSVTVMRDKRTGMYYLGNLERRIVVADCWEFLYNGNRVVLEASQDNLEWDQVGLLTLYNYCRAYDYYREIGWIGGDGLGTPILVLNNYCDGNHKPVDNAAYMGGYMGWQMFLASQGNDFSQCLDVLAHEFTHCVTSSVMTYNAYMNDYGAINEAMSDIQGKTCQMLMEGAANTSWLLGDRGARAVRSLEKPHQFQQPEFTWDVYYMPNVKTPTILNDQGGVHSNSSLLNHLAYRLYEKGGMTLEEGRDFWFTVDCAMVPGTDYLQLVELLPWALKATGLDKYETELRRSLDATRLGVNEIPEVFDVDRALLTLTLPDSALFDDGQWVMQIMTVNVDLVVENAMDIITHVVAGDVSVLPVFIQEMMESQATETPAEPEEDKGLLDAILNALLNTGEADEVSPAEATVPENDAEADVLDEMKGELIEWVREHFHGVFHQGITNGGQDGHTMRIVTVPGYAVPMLMHGIYNEATSDMDELYTLVYLGGSWIDISAITQKNEETGETELSDELTAIVDRLIENIDNIHSYDDALDLLFFRIEGGVNNELPAGRLDAVNPHALETDARKKPTAEAPQPRKSRPKVDEEQKAA